MRECRIWLSWLGLLASAVWATARPAIADQPPTPASSTGKLPIEQIAEPHRQKVRQVIDSATVHGYGPGEAFAGRPDLYHFLLENPDRGVRAWRQLGAPCTEVAALGNGAFSWKDDRGSEVRWQAVYVAEGLRIWFAEGKVRPMQLFPLMPIHAVIVMRYNDRNIGQGRTLLLHQSELFLQTDSKAVALAARMMGASSARLTEQGMAQLEMFFSGLLWYLDQHPERTERLLGVTAAR